MRWDLVVVGGGTAGIVAARTAAGTGARVLLVERDRTGGDCLWTGCVPSKTLLSIAHEVARVRRGSPRAGLPGTDVVPEPDTLWASVRAAIAQIEPDDSPDTLRAAGVTVRRGVARFTGPRTLAVDGVETDFAHALVATGSRPVVPDVPGLDPAAVLTSETLWSSPGLPRRLLVLGGGSIGCELGQAFARLGVEVSVVEQAERLLSTEDEAASAVVTAALEADGVDVRTGVRVVRVDERALHLSDGTAVDGDPEKDAVLVAAGRRADTDGLYLARAGVTLTDTGAVAVDARLRTANPRIWAAGDVTDHPRFTHVAGLHGTTAALNAVLGLHRRAETTVVPRVTYTQPEVGAFGPTVADAERLGLTVRTLAHDEVDRAVTEDDTAGHATLLLDRRGRVVGASLVAPRAGESLAELTLAAREGLSYRTLAGSVHAYPTWGDGVWNAALAELRTDLARPVVRRGVTALRRLRRRLS